MNCIHRDTANKFAGFFLVGGVGFVVDGGLLWLLLDTLGPYVGRLISFLTAVTVTYVLNRKFVFADRATGLLLRESLGKYVAANSIGALLNLGIYTALVAMALPVVGAPLMAFAIASATALFVNFALTNFVVFGKRH
ncbi:MAG: GtrA family protein [Pseudomonadota bacterium]